MDITSIGIIVLLIALLLLGLFFIPRLLTRRAAQQVIKIFRKNNAIDKKTARTIDELGLRPPGMLERMMMGRRDYKPHALNALMQVGIIQTTEDGKVYLSEDKLAELNLGSGVSPYR